MQNASTLNLFIPREVEAKIRHLCSRVHDVEWSGTLFYKVEGSFDDGSFKATCLDICVMDIGSGGATSYDDTADIVAYRIEHPELLQEGVYEGLIHSHNNMRAFFSGVDDNTLIQEGSDLNHFLSLVVCNYYPYVARITRKLVKKVEAKAHIVYTESSYYNTYENRKIELKSSEVTEKDQEDSRESVFIEYYELNIIKESVEEPFSELDERLKAIRESKMHKATESQKTVYNPGAIRPAPAYVIGSGTSGAPKKAFEVEEKTPAPNYRPIEPKQAELFPTKNTGDDDYPPVPLIFVESVNEDLIKGMCTQLLVGSILVDANQIDLEKWVSKMDDLYEKRFGDLEAKENCQNLENWIELLTEQILNTSSDDDMENRVILTYGDNTYDIDDFTQLYVYEMIKFLYDLPESLVKDLMIDELKTYIPNELEEYL